MKNFRELKVWQVGHQLTLDIYGALKGFPRDEQYRLADQMRRAAASIPTNIAEGCGRGTEGEFRQFLYISLGSANELEYQLLLSKDLGYLSDTQYEPLSQKTVQVKRMLITFIRKLSL